MARVSKTLLENISGGLGRQLVFKQYKDKTVVTAYPDMSKVKRSEAQKKRQSVFADAVAYAKSITGNPVKKAEYQKKLKEGKSVYHFAIQEYLAQHRK